MLVTRGAGFAVVVAALVSCGYIAGSRVLATESHDATPHTFVAASPPGALPADGLADGAIMEPLPAYPAPRRSTVTLPPLNWFDDFLGVTVDPRYGVSVAGTGAIGVAKGQALGGVAELRAPAAGPGAARLRLGEDPASGNYDVQNFSVERAVTFESRVRFTGDSNIAFTLGFVGPNDPDFVLAAIYNSRVNNQWTFQANNVATHTYANRPTGFIHASGVWYHFQIVTRMAPLPSATLLVNGVERAVISGPSIPVVGLVPELQVWNTPDGAGTWSDAGLAIDYLHVEQQRISTSIPLEAAGID